MKIFILLTFFVWGLFGSDTKYFLDYKDNQNIIKTIEISKEQFIKTKTNLEHYKDTDKRVVWFYNNMNNDIVKIYDVNSKNTFKNEPKEVKTDIVKKEKINNIKIPYFFILLMLIVIYFFYYQFRDIGKPLKEVSVNDDKKVSLKTDNLSFEELEKKRIETYNDLKYIKSILKDKKKGLYERIRTLKSDIKSKKDLEKLNDDLNLIINDIERFKDE